MRLFQVYPHVGNETMLQLNHNLWEMTRKTAVLSSLKCRLEEQGNLWLMPSRGVIYSFRIADKRELLHHSSTELNDSPYNDGLLVSVFAQRAYHALCSSCMLNLKLLLFSTAAWILIFHNAFSVAD